MDKKKALIVTHEMNPYIIYTAMADIARQLPEQLQNEGMEIRILMPRFGVINERRHRLHEVVRLSGINIVVNNDDFPLIIKVASLPGARMQVYFLDNEDYFKRKGVFEDEEEEMYDDNSERMIFFCKGVLETVKKFGWPPDIVHCHGWMSSLIPMYLKTAYKNEPVFQNSKVITSIYANTFKGKLGTKFTKKAQVKDGIDEAAMAPFTKADNTALNIGAAAHSDGIVIGSQKIEKKVEDFIRKEINVPIKEFVDIPFEDKEAMKETLSEFHTFYKENFLGE